MANRAQGEALVVLEDGRELTLRFDFDAYCAIEDASDLRINEILGEMAGPPVPGTAKHTFRHPKVRSQVMLLYGATRAHHPELDLEQCKELMSHGIDAILWPMLGALSSSLGKDDEAAAGGADGEEVAAESGEGPTVRGVGIGTDSSSGGAKQDSSRSLSGNKRPKHSRGR